MELDAAERSSPPGSPDEPNWEPPGETSVAAGQPPAAYNSIGRAAFRTTRTRRAINQLDGMCRQRLMLIPSSHVAGSHPHNYGCEPRSY